MEKDPFLGQLWLEMLAGQQDRLADADGQVRLDSKEYRNILNWVRDAVDDDLVTHAEYLKQADVAALENGQQALSPGRCGGPSHPSSC
ncbi:hypothetical protein SVIOM342S_09982 [Streptomyces violaceorubidus]